MADPPGCSRVTAEKEELGCGTLWWESGEFRGGSAPVVFRSCGIDFAFMFRAVELYSKCVEKFLNKEAPEECAACTCDL